MQIAAVKNYKTEKKNTTTSGRLINSLNAELNPICHLLTLLGAHHILHVSRERVKAVCVSYVYVYLFDLIFFCTNKSGRLGYNLGGGWRVRGNKRKICQ